ncbi:unnamed protein product [Alternaria alternata]
MARLSGGFQKLHTKLSGWRRLAILNIGAMVLLTLLLCGFTVASILKTDLSEIANEGYNYDEASRGDAVRNTFLFHSSLCTEPTARNVNTVLHLIVNAVSSAVLASSNFFSQVLSSPSRAEVDVSHARGRSLDVGVLSWRNALGLSPFKTVAWVALDQQSLRDSSSPLTIMPPNSSVPFITTVLLANIPQLLLSVWYFAYNAILTRLQLSQEWALYSTSFRPLRVSQPRYFPSIPSDSYDSA